MNKNKLAMAILAVFPLFATQVVQAQSAPVALHESEASAAATDSEAAVAPEKVEAVVVRGQFLGAGSKSAMKLDVPVRDTPFSVSSYTSSFMKAIDTANVGDLYTYMTGVKRAGNTGYDMSIRGFKTGVSDRNAILVDGLPGLAGRLLSPPVIGTERVELVKGPMSVLYGQAQPGGFINIISKKPKGKQALEVDLRGTSFLGGGLRLNDATGYDIAVDATGPIDSEGVFLYRLIAQTADIDRFRTGTFEKPVYLVPSLTWNISEDTAATVSYEYRKVSFGYDIFLAAPNSDISRVADIRTRYQEPGDTETEVGKTFVLNVVHSFANDVTWNFGARAVKHTDLTRAYDSDVGFRPDNVTLRRRARQQYNEREYNFLDTNFNIPFQTGPFKHKALVGLNGGQEIADFDRRQFFPGGVCPGPTCIDIDLYHPVYGVAPALDSLPVGALTTLTHRYTTSNSIGVYVSDLITLSDNWKLSLGARKAKEKQAIKELRVPNIGPQYKESSAVLPLAGLLYHPDKHWTLYASYSTSYVAQPASAQDAAGRNPFVPESAKQFEIGAKAENLLNGKLNATVALFKINKRETLNAVTCATGIGGTCSAQVGGEQSQGVELEVNARPLKNWQITSGYAYTDATIKYSQNAFQVGASLPNVARNSASMWSRYDLDGDMLKGLGVGVGISYTGERLAALPPSAAAPKVTQLPAYTTVDLGLYYDFGRYAFTFKVGNLFDRVYYASAGQTPDLTILPGTPRSLALSVRGHF